MNKDTLIILLVVIGAIGLLSLVILESGHERKCGKEEAECRYDCVFEEGSDNDCLFKCEIKKEKCLYSIE